MLDLDKITITTKMLKLISEIDTFSGKWAFLGQLPNNYLSELHTTTIQDNIVSLLGMHKNKLPTEKITQLMLQVSDNIESVLADEVNGAFAERFAQNASLSAEEALANNPYNLLELQTNKIQSLYALYADLYKNFPKLKLSLQYAINLHNAIFATENIALSNLGKQSEKSIGSTESTKTKSEEIKEREGIEGIEGRERREKKEAAKENNSNSGQYQKTLMYIHDLNQTYPDLLFSTDRMVPEKIAKQVAASSIEGQMISLFTWAEQELTAQEHHPLLIIGTFTIKFLQLDPFLYGNVYIVSILSTLLLLQNGYPQLAFCSIERIIQNNTSSYHLVLNKFKLNQQGNENASIIPWLLFFLHVMQKQCVNLENKVVKLKTEVKQVPELSMQILNLLRKHGRLSIGKIQEMTRANRNTLKKYLAHLVELNNIIKSGKGRGTWYTLA